MEASFDQGPSKRAKPLVLQCFHSKVLKKHWFYCVFAHKCWKSIGVIVFSLKNCEKALVLLCFRWNMLKKHWFYCVFAQKCWKSIGFTVCSLKNCEKALVLLCVRSKMLKKRWFYCVFAQQYWKSTGFIVFSLINVEKTIGFTSKEAEKNWKTIGFIVKPVLATASHQPPATSHGSGVRPALTRRIHYEEPLQTSCLGKKSSRRFFGHNSALGSRRGTRIGENDSYKPPGAP